MGKYKIMLFYQEKASYFVLKEDRIMEQIEPFVQYGAAAALRQGKYPIYFLNSSLWGGCRRRRRRNREKSRLSKAGSGVKLGVDADPTCMCRRGHNTGHWKCGKLPQIISHRKGLWEFRV